MLRLGDDLLFGIFAHLSVKDLLTCSQVCKHFNEVIQNSPTLQLKIHEKLLHRPRYLASEVPGPTEVISAREELNKLKRTELNLFRMQPTYSTFQISPNEQIISVYGRSFITSPKIKQALPPSQSYGGRDHAPLYSLATIWRDQRGGNEALLDTEIRVDFKPIQKLIVADLSQGVVIVAQPLRPGLLRIHVYEIVWKATTLKHETTRSSFELEVGIRSSSDIPELRLRRERRLVVILGDRGWVYNWKTKKQQHKSEHIAFVGRDILACVIYGEDEETEDEDGSENCISTGESLVFFDLSPSPATKTEPILPDLVLRCPSVFAESPSYLHGHLSIWAADYESNHFGEISLAADNQGRSEILNMRILLGGSDLIEWDDDSWISTVLPVHCIQALIDNATIENHHLSGGKSGYMELEPSQWMKYTYWDIDGYWIPSPHPMNHGLKMIQCSLSRTGKYLIRMKDYNTHCAEVDLEERLKRLGVLGKKNQIAVEEKCTMVSEAYKAELIPPSERGLGYRLYECEVGLPRRGSRNIPFFTGDQLWIQHLEGWVSILDFSE
uniref:F-box domain-containing protein n=1 Tax=Kwoniella dejecticola CBS 10117 TaxID=1296121 RepID=A0A1A6A1Q6_9TREE|nr:uncharacterized protein I303_06281 [Kwoniella dejecticola CBS 10117]OBR83994.1 hypothetical protein I303_06281 [Kwoniella dejecticola CBS 10117]